MDSDEAVLSASRSNEPVESGTPCPDSDASRVASGSELTVASASSPASTAVRGGATGSASDDVCGDSDSDVIVVVVDDEGSGGGVGGVVRDGCNDEAVSAAPSPTISRMMSSSRRSAVDPDVGCGARDALSGPVPGSSLSAAAVAASQSMPATARATGGIAWSAATDVGSVDRVLESALAMSGRSVSGRAATLSGHKCVACGRIRPGEGVVAASTALADLA